MPRTREQFGLQSADAALIADQIARRQGGVADLDKEIAECEANADGEFINMRTFSSVKGKTLAKRARKKRAAIQEEIDALTAELDRRSALATA